MPYRDPEARRAANLAAKRRYNASAKAREARKRYYRERNPLPPQINPAPLAEALATWRTN